MHKIKLHRNQRKNQWYKHKISNKTISARVENKAEPIIFFSFLRDNYKILLALQLDPFLQDSQALCVWGDTNKAKPIIKLEILKQSACRAGIHQHAINSHLFYLVTPSISTRGLAVPTVFRHCTIFPGIELTLIRKCPWKKSMIQK